MRRCRTDGGGKARALPNVVHGPNNVARAVLGGLAKFVPQRTRRREVTINGEPGFVRYLDGRPFAVVVLHAYQRRIRTIYVVTNPDKLLHLPPPPD